MSTVALPGFMRWAGLGQHGVDLFFVLSGWLIGTLFWREYSRFGSVELTRFWLRRWLRTIPPYLAGLCLAWLAVFVQRRQAFDWGYLLFVQNYYAVVPYFLVSWSLCIEEHFYVFLPLLMTPLARDRRAVCGAFLLLLAVSPIARFLLSSGGVSPVLGYAQVATHLRMEGLLLGFWAAWIPIVALVAGFLALPVLAEYRVGLTMLPLALVSLLIVMVARAPSRLAGSRVVHAIAVSSYSIYLTHALAIHAVRFVVLAGPASLKGLYFPAAVVAIAATGAGFYFAFERTSIVLRDRLVARRSGASRAPLVARSLSASSRGV